MVKKLMYTSIFIIVSILSAVFGLSVMAKDSTANLKEQKPSRLIGRFQSYQPLETVKTVLEVDEPGKSLEILNPQIGGSDENCNLGEYFLKHFTHLGFNGDVRFVFLNGMLAVTTFYPEDYVGYQRALVKQESLIIRKGALSSKDYKYTESELSPATRISFLNSEEINTRSQNKSTVTWADIYLADKISSCTSKN